MSRTSLILSVFLSSPSDVGPERKLVAEYVDRWNITRGRDRGITYEILSWEDSVAAGISEDGQSVINAGIGDDYDLLIAIFWSRVGSATPRADSGSIEEYQRALDRWKTNRSVDIAFLFKKSPIEFDSIDHTQIKKLNDLKSRVAADGILYKDFRTNDELTFQLDLILSTIAKKHENITVSIESAVDVDETGSAPTSVETASSEAISDDHSERGFLDIIDDLEKNVSESTDFLEGMSEMFASMTSVALEASGRLQESAKLGIKDQNQVKSNLNTVASRMDEVSLYFEKHLPDFENSSSLYARDVLDLIDVSEDFPERASEILEFRQVLVHLRDQMDSAYAQTSDLMDTIKSLQRMTSFFNKSRRRLVSNLNDFLASLNETRGVIGLAIDYIAVSQ